MKHATPHFMTAILLLLTVCAFSGCVDTEPASEAPATHSARGSTASASESRNTPSPEHAESRRPTGSLATQSSSQGIGSVADSSQASRAFQRIWQTSLYPDLTKRQHQCIAELDAPIRSGESLASRQIRFRDCALRVNGSVTENEREWRILHGAIPDLDRDGHGWQVVADPYPGRGNCVVAYLDNDYNLVFAWIGLEG